MKLISIRELYKNTAQYADKTIEIGGWVRNRRPSKQFGFIMLNDGTYFNPVQVVYNDTIENFQEISKINIGAALIVKGTVVLTPDSKQPFEIQASSVTVEGPSTGDYPLQPKRHTMEFLRTITHLRPRTNTFQAVFRVRSLAAMAIHQFFQDRDFVYVHTPLITGSDCEGAGEMFRVTTLDPSNPPRNEDGTVDFSQDFFGKATGLTVSGQLEGEAMAMAFGKIYTFGPTFRAENSNTPRHAAEFWMMEPEMAFADLKDDMILAENMLKYVIRYVLENAPEEMAFFNQFVDKGLIDRLNHVVNSDFDDDDNELQIGSIDKGINLANAIINKLIKDFHLDNGNLIAAQAKILTAVIDKTQSDYPDLAKRLEEIMPISGLVNGALFTGKGMKMYTELRKEIASADEIRLMVSSTSISALLLPMMWLRSNVAFFSSDFSSSSFFFIASACRREATQRSMRKISPSGSFIWQWKVYFPSLLFSIEDDGVALRF